MKFFSTHLQHYPARVWWVGSLEQLLSRGCDWLNDYLVTHPTKLETLLVCQNKSNLIAAAPFLVKEGEKQAREGNVDTAVATFRKALKWNPNLNLDPETKARQLAAPALVTKGESLVSEGKVKEAIAAYAEAQKLDPLAEISADSWNTLCRDGSLRGYAADVLDACEKAVALAPKNSGIRDSRGIARARTGKTKGAIEDFQAFIAWTDDEKLKSQRQSWLDALRAGKNPFTPEEIKKLLN